MTCIQSIAARVRGTVAIAGEAAVARPRLVRILVATNANHHFRSVGGVDLTREKVCTISPL